MLIQWQRRTRDYLSRIIGQSLSTRWKEFNEITYWRGRKKSEGVLSNEHYEYFYTTHFGLDASHYENQVILDIGCGPRGSLAWATMASRRIGLDPLVEKYLELGISHHNMEYIAVPSEKIPLGNGQCDSVFSFNSLDHVDDVDRTLSEIARVTRPDGMFLLLVEINHPPTACEPHQLEPGKLVEALKPEFDCEELQVYKLTGSGIYQSILDNQRVQNPRETEEIGYLSAKFRRSNHSGK